MTTNDQDLEWGDQLSFPDSTTPFPSVSPTIPGEQKQLRFETILSIVVVVLIVLLGAACFFLFRIKGGSTRRITRTQQQQQEPETSAPSTSLHQDQAFLASKIAEMTVEELMTLFSETFERNKRQTRLKAHQILDGNPTEDDVASHTCEDDDNDDDDDDDEEIQRHNNNNDGNENHPSIYLALESVRSILQSHRTNHRRNNNDADSDDDSVIHQKPQQQQKQVSNNKISSHRLVHPGDRRRNVVQGHCVICLEDMTCGQMVVWSQTKSCKHVYHKECLVSFLAHNKRQQVQLLQPEPQEVLDHNPCPTCRQQFVTVCPTMTFQNSNNNNNNATYADTERISNQNANHAASSQNSNGWRFWLF